MVYSYEEAVQYIMNIPKFTKKNPMDNTRHFMECLGNPQDSFKTIHVAGTNGKGSVSAMLSKILIDAGHKTGMFTSPHLVDINERIRINGEEISNDEFTDYFNKVNQVAHKMQEEGFGHPTFFEFIYGMCMTAFEKHNVEYAVVEAGMGGRLDTTNIVKKPLVTIITSIGLDHVEYLGDTIEKIAYEKAGIIKTEVPVVYCGNDTNAAHVIEETAAKYDNKITNVTDKSYNILKKADNHIDFSTVCGYYGNKLFRLPFIAEYQVLNASVALAALEYICNVPYESVFESLKHVVWEGRMDEVLNGVILDGAHNEPGIREFIKTVNEFECSGNKYLLFSAVKDKDYDRMIGLIAENTHFDRIYVTQIQGMRCLSGNVIRKEFEKYTDTSIIEIDDNEKAFTQVLSGKQDEDVVFCCGSLYLVGNIKKIIRRKYND